MITLSENIVLLAGESSVTRDTKPFCIFLSPSLRSMCRVLSYALCVQRNIITDKVLIKRELPRILVLRDTGWFVSPQLIKGASYLGVFLKLRHFSPIQRKKRKERKGKREKKKKIRPAKVTRRKLLHQAFPVFGTCNNKPVVPGGGHGGEIWPIFVTLRIESISDVWGLS